MIPGYETETDRVRKRLKETLTPREKLANWWEYHKAFVAFAAAALFLIGYFVVQARGAVPADYSVGWVSGKELDQDTASAIAGQLAQYGEDVNGDGVVQVALHQCIIDLETMLERGGTSGQKEYGNLMALESDLNCGQSGLFLTDDPQAFQAYSGALLYLDGTEPEPGAEDWENMVVNWNDCGSLEQVQLDGTVYLGCRGCWKEGQREAMAESWLLWQQILNENNQKPLSVSQQRFLTN